MNLRKNIALILLVSCAVLYSVVTPTATQTDKITEAARDLLSGEFRWTTGQPVLKIHAKQLPATPEDNPWVAVKDPSIVRYGDRWHLFCSLRKQKGGEGRIRIGYLSFADWKAAPAARWHLLSLTDDYHGAPQVFYFAPQKKWYLIYQASDASRDVAYGACYSTTDDITAPDSWTLPAPLYKRRSDDVPAGLDFWVICDDSKAHLFYTSLDGKMWRTKTSLANFPNGWNAANVVLRGDIFEASHTYRLAGLNKFLTLIEAKAGSRRYYKAYLADRLDAEWKPLAATRRQPFASPANVPDTAMHWTDSFGHGELIRSGIDQTLVVDPTNLRFFYQGASDADRRGVGYGSIPWKLGIVEPENPVSPINQRPDSR